MNQQLFVGISGIIGAGKSTLTNSLAQALDATPYMEPVKENPYLEGFYADMGRFGFTMQVFLLNKRFQQHQEVVWGQRRAVQDRTIYEDTIFAQMLVESGYMTKLDYDTYLDLFLNMTHFLERPTVILHLDVDPEVALENVQRRARGCETGLSLDYLKALHDGYERWIDTMKHRLTIVRVPWNTFGTTEEVLTYLKPHMGHPTDRWGSKF
jgi:deoxyadenosine kinase